MNFEAIIFYIFLFDSLTANILNWCCPKWYKKKFKKTQKWLPIAKGWAILYLALVLWIGFALLRLGVLPY